MKLIFAQGNPEPKYANTRHNIGFAILNHLASNLKADWQDKPKFKAIVCESELAGEKVLFIKPTTYYNDTGSSIRALVDFYKLDPKNDILVIHDDLALPFGAIRTRKQGSDGGNNGIKSISANIGQEYTRIRVGTYNELRDKMDDASFVLAKFSADENEKLEKNIIPKVIELIETFCESNLEPESYKIIE